MPDYYGKIDDDGKIVGLARVWRDRPGMPEEVWMGGLQWRKQPFLDAIFGEDFDADWGPLSRVMVEEQHGEVIKLGLAAEA